MKTNNKHMKTVKNMKTIKTLLLTAIAAVMLSGFVASSVHADVNEPPPPKNR
jgi:hypothetical protein